MEKKQDIKIPWKSVRMMALIHPHCSSPQPADASQRTQLVPTPANRLDGPQRRAEHAASLAIRPLQDRGHEQLRHL